MKSAATLIVKVLLASFKALTNIQGERFHGNMGATKYTHHSLKPNKHNPTNIIVGTKYQIPQGSFKEELNCCEEKDEEEVEETSPWEEG